MPPYGLFVFPSSGSALFAGVARAFSRFVCALLLSSATRQNSGIGLPLESTIGFPFASFAGLPFMMNDRHWNMIVGLSNVRMPCCAVHKLQSLWGLLS